MTHKARTWVEIEGPDQFYSAMAGRDNREPIGHFRTFALEELRRLP